MPKIKKICGVLLIFSMTLALIPVQSDAAKKKIKLSVSAVSMNTSKTKKIKVKNAKSKVKWTSSKKSIATVTSTGKYSAKIKSKNKQGKTIITAKVQGKKLKCTVRVWKKAKKTSTNSSNTISLIGDRSVEFNSENAEYRVFFALKYSNGTRVASSGKTAVKIVNNENIEIYNKTLYFSPKDFSMWTSPFYGERYLCCIKIKKSDIKPSSSSSGILYFDATLNNGTYFSETAYSVYSLPLLTDKDTSANNSNECSLTLPNFPVTLKYTSSLSGTTITRCTVSDISYEFTKKLSGKYDLKLTYKATKNYDWKGDNATSDINFLSKLYLEDSIVDSWNAYYLSPVIDQPCIIEKTFYDLDPGSYRLSLSDYVI